MYGIDELYREVLLDHNRRPRNFRRLDDADRTAEGFNPLCGDEVNLYLHVNDGVITDVGFQGSGCAISTASASMMTESIKGKTTEEAEGTFGAFRRMLTGGSAEDGDEELLGDLEVLAGVSAYPVRIKCAVLSWHTLHAAIGEKDGAVSTE